MRVPHLVALAALLAAPASSADILSGTARVHGGYAGGLGLSGDLEDESFAEGAAGATYGARVGVEVFFVRLSVGHDQYVTGDGLVGTWTTLPMIGFDTEFGLGGGEAVAAADGTLKPGASKWLLHLGFGAGFGLGTGQQIEPPLDNSEVTDKGFLFEAEVGIARKIAGGVSIGIAVPVQGRFLFKNGADAVVNDPDDRYRELAYSALLGLRWKLKFL